MATFSVTDLGTYRACRQKWDWSSNARNNLTGVGSGAEPLELGSIIHRVLADWIVFWNSEDDNIRYHARNKVPYTLEVGKEKVTYNFLSALFLQHASKRQAEITKAFEERTGHKIQSDNLASLHNVVELGVAMMKNYEEYHKAPLPAHMRFAMPEQEVLIPVPGTEHPCENCFGTGLVKDHVVTAGPTYYKKCDTCNGTKVVFHHLSATLDGLLQDDKDRFLVLEHKTYENRPKLRDLYMNDQFTGYAWVVRALGIGRVYGVAYDGMWKRDKPPKSVKAESGVNRPGKMDDLFIRKVLEKEDAELDVWGENLTKEINEMANDPAIYPNVMWSGCGGCPFIDPCRMKMRGEDPSKLLELRYTQREVVRGGKTTEAIE